MPQMPEKHMQNGTDIVISSAAKPTELFPSIKITDN